MNTDEKRSPMMIAVVSVVSMLLATSRAPGQDKPKPTVTDLYAICVEIHDKPELTCERLVADASCGSYVSGWLHGFRGVQEANVCLPDDITEEQTFIGKIL